MPEEPVDIPETIQKINELKDEIRPKIDVVNDDLEELELEVLS